MIERSSKKRHEIRGHHIRALYGHSLPGLLIKREADPPSVLFHGTSPEAAEAIAIQGLQPMGRQYVHLSVDTNMAREVGLRKSSQPVILQIDSKTAKELGNRFFVGNDQVWLADAVVASAITTQ